MIDPTMTPQEALHLALKREQAAEEFYQHTAASVAEESVRKMFEFLAKEERRHQRLIQDELDKNVLQEM